MTKPERPRQRVAERSTSKVPLTFYRQGDSQPASDSPFRNKERPSPGKIQRFFAGLLDGIIILALVAGLIYSLFINSTPKIVLSNGSYNYHSTITYKEAAQKYLNSLKNRNKITFDQQGVVDSMQKQFPEIAAAYIELPVFAQTPVVHLSISKPSLLLNNNGKHLIVTEEGYAVFEPASFNTKNLTTVEDQSGFNAEAGKQVISSSSVKFIDELLKQLKHANIQLGQLILPPKAQELDLRAKDRPYYVKVYLGGDVLQQAGQFIAARHQFEKDNTQPSEYLDVRVPGKIYYK
jgi:hypothetical protein